MDSGQRAHSHAKQDSDMSQQQTRQACVDTASAACSMTPLPARCTALVTSMPHHLRELFIMPVMSAGQAVEQGLLLDSLWTGIRQSTKIDQRHVKTWKQGSKDHPATLASCCAATRMTSGMQFEALIKQANVLSSQPKTPVLLRRHRDASLPGAVHNVTKQAWSGKHHPCCRPSMQHSVQ